MKYSAIIKTHVMMGDKVHCFVYFSFERLNAEFNPPSGLTANKEGNILYVCDRNNNRVRRITIE